MTRYEYHATRDLRMLLNLHFDSPASTIPINNLYCRSNNKRGALNFSLWKLIFKRHTILFP
jgi:hypothetical protein